MRFFSLAALAGRAALAGVAVSRPIPLRRCFDVAARNLTAPRLALAVLRFARTRVARFDM
jgi:hypothetical protein